jgi:hypothetical protein
MVPDRSSVPRLVAEAVAAGTLAILNKNARSHTWSNQAVESTMTGLAIPLSSTNLVQHGNATCAGTCMYHCCEATMRGVAQGSVSPQRPGGI